MYRASSMKYNCRCVSYILQSLLVSTKLTSFNEMDYLFKSFCLYFLTIRSVQVLHSKIPLGATFLCLGKLIPSSRKGNAITSVQTCTKHTFTQSDTLKGTVMGKREKSFSSETSPNKKLKCEATKDKLCVENIRTRPNYFVAVQISNPKIHEAIQRIQDHIIVQNRQLNACMNSIPTLHITLMVMSISDLETHERALKALQNIHKEFNDEMCENPLKLEFCGLGHFRNRVLYAKIKENESFYRLQGLAQSVRKHFAKFEIFSTDEREFNPHLTIAKIDFSKRKQKVLKKIEPSLYETFIDAYVGSETIVGIQLLSMRSPKNEAGYYIGKTLIFESNTSGSNIKANIADVNEKKKDIRKKIASLAQNVFK